MSLEQEIKSLSDNVKRLTAIMEVIAMAAEAEEGPVGAGALPEPEKKAPAKRTPAVKKKKVEPPVEETKEDPEEVTQDSIREMANQLIKNEKKKGQGFQTCAKILNALGVAKIFELETPEQLTAAAIKFKEALNGQA